MLPLSSGSLEDGGFNPRGVTTQIPNIDIFAADRTSNLTRKFSSARLILIFLCELSVLDIVHLLPEQNPERRSLLTSNCAARHEISFFL
jgi:hypothetical protein